MRLRRTLSWGNKAKELYEDNDLDSTVLFYWIALNAMYATYKGLDEKTPDRELRRKFLKKILTLDTNAGDLHNFLWMGFSDSIRNLLNNQFVFGPYWQAVSDEQEASDWRDMLERDKNRAQNALRQPNGALSLLQIVFDRLNVLRNQLVHGSATYESTVNRPQIKTSAHLLHELIPLMQRIFEDHPEVDWGEPAYPPQTI